MNWFSRTAVALLAFAWANPAAWAQTADPANLRGDSAQTRKRLAEADQKLIAGKTSDAVDDLQRVLDEASTDLISIDGKQYRTAQWIAHQILAKLPPEALKNYRDRVDAPARKLLEAARQSRDTAPLWQLLDRYFVSRPADEGSLLLGDLLFERGEFRAAELVWRRLSQEGKGDVAYPGSQMDPAQVSARLVLAAIFSGDLDRARSELAAFQTAYGNAKGTLAGKSGSLASLLSEQLKNPPKLQSKCNGGDGWPAFGGGSDHSGSVGIRLPLEWSSKPAWMQSLPSRSHTESPRQSLLIPFGHPVIVGGTIFVTDGHRLCGFDLQSGKPTDPTTIYRSAHDEKVPQAPCPALTASGDRLYARSGPAVFRSPDLAGLGRESDSTLICFAISKDAPEGVKELWRLKPPSGDGNTPAYWEGAPEVSGRRMWAAYVRYESGRIVHGIASYEPADAEEKPDRPSWVADVCDSPLSPANEKRTRQELLTLVGRHVVFCSNTGAIVALEAISGRRAWAFRYPRSSRADSNRSSDPAPAIVYGGKIFVAPTDGKRVYALDPTTGAVLWESEDAEGVQIVGVSGGKLIVSVTHPYRSIRGLNVANGSYLESEGGWLPPSTNLPASVGRGFTTEDRAFWPNAKGITVLKSTNGRPCEFPLKNPNDTSPKDLSDPRAWCFGNVAYANGAMVVVTSTQVWAYFSDQREFGQRSDRAPSDPVRLEFERIASRGEVDLAEGRAELARAALAKIVAGKLPAAYRAWAAARLLLLVRKNDSVGPVPESLRSLITPELEREWILTSDGMPTTLGRLLDGSLGRPSENSSIESLEEKKEVGNDLLLSPDAAVARTFHLPRGSSPLGWLQGPLRPRHIYVSALAELLSVSIDDGLERRYEAVDRFTHVAETAEGFLVVGPFAIALYGRERTPLWVFRVPLAHSLPAFSGDYWMFSDGTNSKPELSSFRFSGRRLMALLGQRHLIAFDIKNRIVAWVLGADGTSGFHSTSFPDAPRFGSEFSGNRKLTLVQLSDGRRFFIHTDSGRVLHPSGIGEQTSRVFWSSPPAQVERNRFAVADAAGSIRMLSPFAARVQWTFFEEKRQSSLSGVPSQIRAFEDFLLVATLRNHGIEIDRLNSATGKSEWSEGPLLLEADRFDLRDADADADALYVSVGNALVAIDLKAGKLLWQSELPDLRGERGWSVRVGQNCAIAYPLAAIPREAISDRWSAPRKIRLFGSSVELPRKKIEGFWSRMLRALHREPSLQRLPGLALGLYDAWVARSLPIVMLDLESGRKLGRIDIPAAGPAITVCFDKEIAVVATGESVCWLK